MRPPTEAWGMRDLQRLLEMEHSLDLSGWTLLAATAVSPEGSAIVGWGTNPEGQVEAWLAVLPLP